MTNNRTSRCALALVCARLRAHSLFVALARCAKDWMEQANQTFFFQTLFSRSDGLNKTSRSWTWVSSLLALARSARSTDALWRLFRFLIMVARDIRRGHGFNGFL